jgi:hypothetical protein
MTDVVVKLPVHEGAEAQLFGDYLTRFITSLGEDADSLDADRDAPYLIVRSNPQPHLDMKVLIFQKLRAAQDFSHGWSQALTGLSSKS